jgi:putative ubiquitin-RnfH superfamily antitoxin RatB of RatAB toxin-antitoxin module
MGLPAPRASNIRESLLDGDRVSLKYGLNIDPSILKKKNIREERLIKNSTKEILKFVLEGVV